MATDAKFFAPPPIPIGEDPPVGDVPPEWSDLDMETRRKASEIKTAIEYILDPAVPAKYKEEFARYEMLISRSLALAQLPSWDYVYRYLDIFDVVIIYLKLDHPDIAVKRMARMVMELQLTRSVGGFERQMQVSTRQVIEQAKMEETKKKRRGILPFR